MGPCRGVSSIHLITLVYRYTDDTVWFWFGSGFGSGSGLVLVPVWFWFDSGDFLTSEDGVPRGGGLTHEGGAGQQWGPVRN